jgi:aryl-alcohol dehydrogenase-like predicted oxidoreductase
MGTARLGALWQGRSFSEGVRAVEAAVDAGIRLIDTADCYARGLAEIAVGRGLRGRRERVLLCTKAGLVKTPGAMLQSGQLGAWRRAGAGGSGGRCFAAQYLERRLEGSLRRLRTDAVDVFLLHEPDAATVREAAFVPAVERILTRGKALAFGVSVQHADAALAALELPRLALLQVPHNEACCEIVPAVAAEATRLGVRVVAAAPFGGGTPADAAKSLRRSLDTSGVDCVLVGMSRPGHVAANVAALAT